MTPIKELIIKDLMNLIEQCEAMGYDQAVIDDLRACLKRIERQV